MNYEVLRNTIPVQRYLELATSQGETELVQVPRYFVQVAGAVATRPAPPLQRAQSCNVQHQLTNCLQLQDKLDSGLTSSHNV